MPKVSVIIPVYNTEKYLKKCLNSIINQTLKDIEIICINDGSTDNSLKILENYAQKDDRIIIQNQKNSGAGSARNKGISLARGECLYFIDSDDFVDITLLEKMYNQITKTNADICLCKRTDYDELRNKYYEITDSLKINLLPSTTFNVIDISDRIFQFCAIGVFSKIFRSTFIKSNNIEFQNLSSCNDVFFYCATLSLANLVTYIDEPLVISVRCRKGSISSKRGSKINNILIAGNKVKEFLVAHNCFDLFKNSFYKRFTHNFYYEICQCEDKKLIKDFEKKINDFLPIKYKFIFKKYKFFGYLKLISNFIFSIKNRYDENKKYKIITILGIKIKFKRR